MWSQDATVDSARDTPTNYHAGTTSDPSTDISPDTRFYAQLVHNTYSTNRPTHIVSDVSTDLYRTDTWGGTIKSMSTYDAYERRAVYYKRSIQSSDIATIYLPIDRDRDEVLPIYLSIRGTADLWDVFKDVNFLLNYGTGSTLNLTGYTAKFTQLYNDTREAMLAVANHPLVITSHSLGCKYALDIWKALYNDPDMAPRLHKNVMFNPFLVIDDDYSLLSTYPPLFKNSIKTHIIDGDIASVVYKNHPINPTGMTIYANIVDRDADGWINTLYDATYASSLDVRNHQLGAFTGGETQYPDITHIAYTEEPSERRIRSVRTYSMTAELPGGTSQIYTNEPIYIEYDFAEGQYLGNNPVMESSNMEYYDLDYSIADERDMIYRNGQWSLPMYLDQTYSREWYLFRSGYVSNDGEIAYYLAFAAQPNELVYVKTYADVDYTTRFSKQQHNLEKAYLTITEAQLALIQFNHSDTSSAVHLRAQWFINLPPLEGYTPHTGYGNGQRRTLTDLTVNYLPVHGRHYKIRHSYLSGRVLGIYRLTSPAAFTDEGQLLLTYEGNAYETSAATTNTIFKCHYNDDLELYYFLDIQYFDQHNTNSTFINSATEVYIGEGNIPQHNWAAVTAGNNTGFQLIENTPENVTQQHTGHPINITSKEYFLMKNTANHYIFVNDEWAFSDPAATDYRGSIDPITTMSGYTPDWWGLWKFEEVSYP